MTNTNTLILIIVLLTIFIVAQACFIASLITEIKAMQRCITRWEMVNHRLTYINNRLRGKR